MNEQNMAYGKTPQATHEALAEQWARARGRLFDARGDSARATQALDEAERLEREAWDALEVEAGRAKPCAPTLVPRR